VAGGIYLRQGDDLIAMIEEQYESEDLLQALLETHPNLLAGDELEEGENVHSWLLLAREASLASEPDGGGRWSVDHLFIDRQGIPTIVEVKRSSDTRIRREVVGQMLDYAANAVVYWELPKLVATFDAGPAIGGVLPAERLAAFLGPDEDPEEFWGRVATNLAAGKLRLVFVADEIPSELRRIVEFLNEQMTTTEVLAIEVKQYRDAQGRHQTLVPRILGRTEAARQAKGGPTRRRWDEESWMAAAANEMSSEEFGVARKLFDWAKRHDPPLVLTFGTGATTAAFVPGMRWDQGSCFPMGFYTHGTGYFNFGPLASAPPFDREEQRRELKRRLEEIPGIEIPEERLEKYPSLELASLVDDQSYRSFVAVIEWIFDEARAAAEQA
jgi:hypothetical protein